MVILYYNTYITQLFLENFYIDTIICYQHILRYKFLSSHWVTSHINCSNRKIGVEDPYKPLAILNIKFQRQYFHFSYMHYTIQQQNLQKRHVQPIILNTCLDMPNQLWFATIPQISDTTTFPFNFNLKNHLFGK